MNIKIDKRYIKVTRESSIQSLTHAVIELITNSVDAYKNIDLDEYPIDIIIYLNPKKSYLIIRDQAIGMNINDMETKILTIGSYTSSEKSRGVIGRGAKDICALGDVKYIGIKNNLLSICKINQDYECEIKKSNMIISNEQRNKYGIQNNGFYVKLEFDANQIESIQTFSERIIKNYQLRDILSDETIKIEYEAFKYDHNCVLLDKYQTRLQYTTIDENAKLVYRYSFDVEHYNVPAEFELYMSSFEIKNPRINDELEYGVLVKSSNSIYDIGALYYDDQDVSDNRFHANLKYFFGFLKCDYIDTLIREYTLGNKTYDNPSLIIDPNRRYGLNKSHPFIKSLFEIPYKLLQLSLNRMDDYRMENCVDLGDSKNIIEQFGTFMSEFVLNDETLYAWRSKQDQKYLYDISVKSIENLHVNKDFMYFDKDYLEQLRMNPNQPYVKKSIESRSPITIKFSNNINLKNSHDVLYYPNKVIIRINLNYPTIKPYIYIDENNKINYVHVGKAMVVIGDEISLALSRMITRQKILSGQLSVNVDQFNEILYIENINKLEYSYQLSNIVNEAIKKIK